MNKIKSIKLITLLFVLFSMSVMIFGQTDVPRETRAVTYPLDEKVYLNFRGTTRFPRMKGEAKIERTSKNGTEIELTISKMPRPFELGAGYATYVLWAISPDGQVDNLGEIKRRGFFEFDSKISVTTPLQTFALIVTAEPHFLVRQPSRAVMLENLNPYTKTGKRIVTTASIQYFGNSSDYFNDARTPVIAEVDYSKTPQTILQARQAVSLAKFAGAGRDAQEEINEAEMLLKKAEDEWKSGRDEEVVDITARKAVSVAVRAETTAQIRKTAREKRNEKSRADAELREAEDKYLNAQDEINALKAELAQETRRKELAERDAENYLNQVKQLQNEISSIRKEAQGARIELAKIEGENVALQRQKEKAEKIARIQANEDVLMTSLKRFGTVQKGENGIVVTLPETFWSSIRVSEFNQTKEPELSSMVDVLANSTDYKVIIESHIDNNGTPEELQTLTQERAQAIADKLLAFGVSPDRIQAKGFGATLPVAPNTNNRNRAKNRRVHILLLPILD